MTVKDKMIEILGKQGMDLDHAREMMDGVASGDEEFFKNPADTWDNVYYNTWFITLRKVFVMWVDKYKPKAEYRDRLAGSIIFN